MRSPTTRRHQSRENLKARYRSLAVEQLEPRLQLALVGSLSADVTHNLSLSAGAENKTYNGQHTFSYPLADSVLSYSPYQQNRTSTQIPAGYFGPPGGARSEVEGPLPSQPLMQTTAYGQLTGQNSWPHFDGFFQLDNFVYGDVSVPPVNGEIISRTTLKLVAHPDNAHVNGDPIRLRIAFDYLSVDSSTFECGFFGSSDSRFEPCTYRAEGSQLLVSWSAVSGTQSAGVTQPILASSKAHIRDLDALDIKTSYGTEVVVTVEQSITGEVSSSLWEERGANLQFTILGIPVPGPDVRPISLTWDGESTNSQTRFLNFNYEIGGEALTRPVSLDLYWADDSGQIIEDVEPVFSGTSVIGRPGSYVQRINLNRLNPDHLDSGVKRPENATTLVMVVDELDEESESNEDNNQLGQPIPYQAILFRSLHDKRDKNRPAIMMVHFVPNFGFSLDQAALLLGVDHFNYVQYVTSIPEFIDETKTWRPALTVRVMDNVTITYVPTKGFLPAVDKVTGSAAVLGLTDTLPPFHHIEPSPLAGNPDPVGLSEPVPLPFLDPIQMPKQAYYFMDEISGEGYVPRADAEGDGLPQYYVMDHLDKHRLDVGAGYKTNFEFFDKPNFPKDIFASKGKDDENQTVKFETSLVGVSADGNESKESKGWAAQKLGTQFQWDTNNTGVSEPRIILAASSDEAPVEEGSVFNLQFNVPSGPLSPWHNARLSLDVNDDESIAPNDALEVINYINAFGSGGLIESPVPLPPAVGYIDADDDLFLSPADALSIINRINAAEGEGEPSAATQFQDQVFAHATTQDDWLLALLALEFEGLPRRRGR